VEQSIQRLPQPSAYCLEPFELQPISYSIKYEDLAISSFFREKLRVDKTFKKHKYQRLE